MLGKRMLKPLSGDKVISNVLGKSVKTDKWSRNNKNIQVILEIDTRSDYAEWIVNYTNHEDLGITPVETFTINNIVVEDLEDYLVAKGRNVKQIKDSISKAFIKTMERTDGLVGRQQAKNILSQADKTINK